MTILEISAPHDGLSGRVALPVSKSHLNRILMLRQLYQLPIDITPTEQQDLPNDCDIMYVSLHQLAENHTLYNVQDAGTVFRFLTAILSITPGEHVLTGTHRLLSRPINELIESLNALGASITRSVDGSLQIIGNDYITQSRDLWEIDCSTTSQSASALVMLAPLAQKPITIQLKGTPVSLSYLDLTISIMKQAGFILTRTDKLIDVQPYDPARQSLKLPHPEADWSGAGYFIALAALQEGSAFIIENLRLDSHHPDRALVDVIQKHFPFVHLEQIHNDIKITSTDRSNTASNIQVDFTNMIDQYPTLKVLCYGLGVNLRAIGIDHLKVKESDRGRVLDDAIHQFEEDSLQPLDVHDDHRMAMSLACLSCINPIRIQHPDVVKKSFPKFWDQLLNLNFTIKEV
ncbi:MAG: hypothetical protein H6608_04160 [Flavobacteriales bacterium]|nr:hypothetical protein [Bacteroidota bacterium]MCB9240300.1 hypothetical protein [Flavobacteriales bacterium]